MKNALRILAAALRLLLLIAAVGPNRAIAAQRPAGHKPGFALVPAA